MRFGEFRASNATAGLSGRALVEQVFALSQRPAVTPQRPRTHEAWRCIGAARAADRGADRSDSPLGLIDDRRSVTQSSPERSKAQSVKGQDNLSSPPDTIGSINAPMHNLNGTAENANWAKRARRAIGRFFAPAAVFTIGWTLFLASISPGPISAAPADESPAGDDRPPLARCVFRCNFDQSWDANFDGWPTGWTRRDGRGYPHFIRIEIDGSGPPGGGRSLRIDLNGAAASAQSPLITVDPLFEYQLQVDLAAENLGTSRVSVALLLLDEDRRPVQTLSSPLIGSVNGWRRLSVGPTPIDGKARFAMITLSVQPGQQPDLNGAVRFGDLWLGRLPHLRVETAGSGRVLASEKRLVVECMAAGQFDAAPRLAFTVLDQEDRPVAEGDIGLELKPMSAPRRPSAKPAPEPPQSLGAVNDDLPDGARPMGQATARWTAPPLPPGWYRVCARLSTAGGIVIEKQLCVAVIHPAERSPESCFGWSLPRGRLPLKHHTLEELIDCAGVGWVKLPLWIDDETSDAHVERIAQLLDSLEDRGIRTIGLLAAPPSRVTRQFDRTTNLAALADMLSADQRLWLPSITASVTRFSMQVRHWQLGDDRDMSFVGRPAALKRAKLVADVFAKLAPNAELGLPWDGSYAPPHAWTTVDSRSGSESPVPVGFVALSSQPPMSASELAWLLADTTSAVAAIAHSTARPAQSNGMQTTALPKSPVGHTAGPRRAVVLAPLPADQYARTARWADYVDRIIAAKVYGTQWIFATDPFDPQEGLLTSDGAPNPFFVLWRTAAYALGGAEHLGRLELPAESNNDLFAKGDTTVLVVRRNAAAVETINVTAGATLTDAWGRSERFSAPAGPRPIEVGPLPVFLEGVPPAAARWQLDLALQKRRIPAEFDKPHANAIELVNPFPQGIHGRVRIVAPDQWQAVPREADFRLAAGERWRFPFELRIPSTAGSGKRFLRFDFDLQAEQPIRLSVYRAIEIGLGDVMIELTSRIDEQGRLEVIQRTINDTDQPASFRCELFIPGRRSLRSQIIGLGRGQDLKSYLIDDGRELVGRQLWLRAEEIGGPRILNYRFNAAQGTAVESL